MTGGRKGKLSGAKLMLHKSTGQHHPSLETLSPNSPEPMPPTAPEAVKLGMVALASWAYYAPWRHRFQPSSGFGVQERGLAHLCLVVAAQALSIQSSFLPPTRPIWRVALHRTKTHNGKSKFTPTRQVPDE